MGEDYQQDPEVIADLQLRAATLRDRSRAREMPAFEAAKFVDSWPCRACKQPVPVTDDGVDRYQVFNRQLARLGQERLDHTKIMFCDSCRNEYQRTAADRRRGQVDRMAVVIKKLKASTKPEEEREMIKQLEAWHHPDVSGLVQAIRNRLDGTKAKGKARGEL